MVICCNIIKNLRGVNIIDRITVFLTLLFWFQNVYVEKGVDILAYGIYFYIFWQILGQSCSNIKEPMGCFFFKVIFFLYGITKDH